MSSMDIGKDMALRWIRDNVKKGGQVLDVGACDGKYGKLLRPDYLVDAIEVFEPNINKYRLWNIYNTVICADIRTYDFFEIPGCCTQYYHLIIFGDVLEHMTEDEAVEVLKKAKRHTDAILVAVPFMWEQGEIYGNPYERHIQDHLTHERFMELYEGFEPLLILNNYGYYVWRCDK